MYRILPILLALLVPLDLRASAPGPELDSTSTVQVDAGRKSALRDVAYLASGSGFFYALKGHRFPFTGGKPVAGPFPLPVDWQRAARDNPGHLPLQDWTGLDYGCAQAAVAVLAVRHLPGSDAWFDAYFDRVRKCDHLSRSQKRKIAANVPLIRARSTVFIVSFDEATAQLVYYPGQILFRGGADRKLGKWVKGTPPDIRKGLRSDYCRLGSSQGLMAILNGTFSRVDNEGEWLGDRFARGGFGYDFREYYEPSPEMGTAAIYQDGSFRLGTLKSLPHRDRIRTFAQNRFMVVEDGKPGRDARARRFVRYHDQFARAYLFRDGRGHFGYVWTLDVPQDVMADLAIRLGIRDLLMTDIHSTVHCTLSDPGSPLSFADEKDYGRRAIDFVPVFEDCSKALAPLVGLSRLVHKNIQSPYVYEAFRGAWDDFFAVFTKDAPEAKRMQARRDP